MKYSEYLGAKGCESFKVKVFWRQKARVILRMKISGVIKRYLIKTISAFLYLVRVPRHSA
jgi:hypothetical protein